MKSNIFIPKVINVGYQKRSDTYTKKLAYVIYYDEKGKLRKETSWNSWRDDQIKPNEFNNEPTSGFVLNKKVGDYDSGWNHRHAYVRIYDPRNFEFEITIENLLYILENTSVIKGKGLEGNFVYGWDGKDLVLIPTDSPDYKEITEYNEIVHQNNFFKSKDLKLGATYLDKTQDQWIYLGRYHARDSKGNDDGNNYFFAHYYKTWRDKYEYIIQNFKSISGKFIGIHDDNCHEKYAELVDKMQKDSGFLKADMSKNEYVKYDLEYFKNIGHSYMDVLIKVDGKYVEGNLRMGYRYSYYSSQYYINYKVGRTYERTDEMSLNEIFNKYEPTYINRYYSNGDFCERSYYYEQPKK
jgi:hypothetical protein